MFQPIQPDQDYQTHQNANKFYKNASASSLKTQQGQLIEKKSCGRKLPDKLRERLIELITVQNYNMKEAAKMIGISYSTAKKVFKQFRRNLREQNDNKIYGQGSSIRSQYLQICAQCAQHDQMDMPNMIIPQIQQRTPTVKIISLVAGKEQIRSKNLIICGICGQQNKGQENIKVQQRGMNQ